MDQDTEASANHRNVLRHSFDLTQTVDFVAWPPKTQPKSPMTGEGQHEVPLVQGNLASQLKINTKKVFWPHKDSGFCGLAAQNIAKSTQDWLKANLKDYWSKEIWPPSSKDCNPDYFMWSEVEREVNKHPQHPCVPQVQDLGGNGKWLTWTGRSSSPPTKNSGLGLRLL